MILKVEEIMINAQNKSITSRGTLS
jgi:hypothetical protein